MYYRRRQSFAGIIVLILIIIILAVVPQGRNIILGATRSTASFVVYSFGNVVSLTLNSVKNSSKTILYLSHLARENAKIKEENANLKVKQSILDESLAENERLREAMDFTAYNPYGLSLIPARVSGRSLSNWFETIMINKSAKADKVVINQQGLVGKIYEQAKDYSKVLLVTDSTFAISAVDQRSRTMGVVEGEGRNTLSMKYVSAQADIEVGDLIVTSSQSTIFPAGIPIGKVVKINKKDYDFFQEVKLAPAVDFSKLEEVFIVSQ